MTVRNYDRIDMTFGGTLEVNEQWSVGLCIASPDRDPLDPSLTDLDVIAGNGDDRWNAFMATPGVGSLFSTAVQYQETRTYFRPASTSSAVAVGHAGTARNGSGTQIVPAQVALCCTLNTNFAGRSNRGRVYLPLLAAPVHPTGSQLGVIAGALIALITGLAGDATTALGVAVGPVVGANAKLITQVHIDSVLDTQRRRRNGLVPANFGTADVV